MLLTNGKTIFFDNKDRAVSYFTEIGYKCPQLTNPADYFLNIMSIESIEVEDVDNWDIVAYDAAVQKRKEAYDSRVQHFIASFEKSEKIKNLGELIKGLPKIEIEDSDYNLSWL